MKALLCRALGPPETLELADLADPSPGPGEVLVRVAFAALNFFDTLIIEGKYQVKPAPPFSPAGEFAGTVEAVGAGVETLKPGDRVLGFTGHGAARERLVARSEVLMRMPEALSLEKAAGLPIAYGTVFHALKQRASLARGETLVVLGAAGGVGLAGVEVGAAMGARVIACASSDEKCAFARDHGAEETINVTAQDFRAELKRLAPKGVDVALDPVGGALTEATLRSMAWKGRLLVVGFASGDVPKIALNLPLLKGCDIRGVYWGDFTQREPALNAANMRTLMDWAVGGHIATHPPTILPLARFAEGFALLAGRKAMGKVLLAT